MKTVLLLRGPVRLTETLLLGFLGDHDARVDLVPYVTLCARYSANRGLDAALCHCDQSITTAEGLPPRPSRAYQARQIRRQDDVETLGECVAGRPPLADVAQMEGRRN